ncbi:MAG: hypothetical protein Q8P05_04250 [Candidatus Diapherotrites archaeon]|nr:hypothetical protein [Candidatus Diapherotrites archaeon]
MELSDVPRLTEKDRKALRADVEKNRKERMAFIDYYADWLKKTPNSVWSKQHAKFLGKK